MQIFQQKLSIQTQDKIQIIDLNHDLNDLIKSSGMRNGIVTINSLHTTTALSINEYEKRLLHDIKTWLARLAPINARYKHNDIHLRDCADDEPENTHAHLMAMHLGSNESIALQDGNLALGQWQSVLLFELDGPRQRQVNVQIMGE